MDGMERVTAGENGTARIMQNGLRGLPPLTGLRIGAKTGTAQACTNCGLPDHGWFAGIGGPPEGNPEIVAVLFVEYGESGSGVSGMAANAVNFYLDRKYGRPFERNPVPRDRSRMGLPVDWASLARPIVDNPFDLDEFRREAFTYGQASMISPFNYVQLVWATIAGYCIALAGHIPAPGERSLPIIYLPAGMRAKVMPR